MAKLNFQLPDESINQSKESPLFEFTWLLVGFFTILIPILFFVQSGTKYFVRALPESFEKNLHNLLNTKGFFDSFQIKNNIEINKYHQNLLAKLNDSQEDLDFSKLYKVHLSCLDQNNAFALPGGHIVLSKGLYDNLEHENALLFVLAHEIGHHRNRHLLEKLVQNIGSSLIFSILLGSVGDSGLKEISDKTALLNDLKFSRDEEKESDEYAIYLFKENFISFDKSTDFFETILKNEQSQSKFSEFLSTHPSTKKRIELIKANSQSNQDSSPKIPTKIKDNIQSICKNI